MSVKTAKFEELRSLDLRQCASVGDIVKGLRYCAFGARMLGEAAHTIHEMATAKDKPLLSTTASHEAARRAVEKIRRQPLVP
jgi:deoxyhypusine synthase